MKQAHRELIKAAFRLGFTCSVYDGGAWQLKRSRSLSACIAAIRSVDEAELRFRDKSGEIVGWALVSDAVDLEPDEKVINHTCTRWIEDALAEI